MSTLETLLMFLRIAQEVSAKFPISGLTTALALTVNIIEKSKVRLPYPCPFVLRLMIISRQEAKDTQEGCRSLAKHAARFSSGFMISQRNTTAMLVR